LQKEANKKLRFKSLCTEIQRTWNVKCIPVITGATGIVTKVLKNNLEAIPGKHSVDSLQKIGILGTSHIIRKVLESETGTLSGRDRGCYTSSSTRKKRPVTRENKNNRIIIIITIIIIIIIIISSFVTCG